MCLLATETPQHLGQGATHHLGKFYGSDAESTPGGHQSHHYSVHFILYFLPLESTLGLDNGRILFGASLDTSPGLLLCRLVLFVIASLIRATLPAFSTNKKMRLVNLAVSRQEGSGGRTTVMVQGGRTRERVLDGRTKRESSVGGWGGKKGERVPGGRTKRDISSLS